MNEQPFQSVPRDMKPVNPRFNPKLVKLFVTLGVIAVLVLAVVFNGVYTLNTGEEAVITRFGQYQDTITSPGLQFKVPFIDQKYIVNVERIQRLEFGFRTQTEGETTDVLEESSMLTGDENLVIADWAIMYRVKNSYNYTFKVNDPIQALRVIAESSYRRVVASHPLDDILTNQKESMQNEIMTDLQVLSDRYELGVLISAVQLQDAMPPDEVKASFLDVSSAKEQKNAKINEASQYENEQLPMARGEAAKQINQAEAYKAQRINEAQGSVARYAAIEAEYSKQPQIMRTRLYLEMIREVLPRVQNVYIVDEGNNTLQFLPLTGNKSSLPVEGVAP